MNARFSKFNLVASCNDEIIIFNSLSSNKIKMSLDNYEKLVDDEKKNMFSASNETISKLMQLGFVQNEDVDEDKLAFIKYIEHSNNNVLHLIILPTMNCNFRCTYCYEDFSGGAMSHDIIKSVVEFVEKKLKSYEILKVSWFGGEPLLALDVIEHLSDKLIKLASFYRKPYLSDMTTNGYLLDIVTFKKLIKCKIHSFQVTIDGNQETHNSGRHLSNGGETYDRILSNLLQIKNQTKTQLVSFILRINVTKSILKDLNFCVKEISDNFSDDDRFSLLFKQVGNWGGESVRSMQDELIESTGDIYDKLQSIDTLMNVQLDVFAFTKSPLCYAAMNGEYVIMPNGQLKKCTLELYSDENDVGSIQENGKLVLKNNICNWIYSGLKINDKCRSCALYASCFNSTCPNARQKNDFANGYLCENKEKLLLLTYKFNKAIFEELTYV